MKTVKTKVEPVKQPETPRSFVSTAIELLEDAGLLKNVRSMDEIVVLIKEEFGFDCTTDLVEDIYGIPLDSEDRMLVYKNLGLYYPDIHDDI